MSDKRLPPSQEDDLPAFDVETSQGTIRFEAHRRLDINKTTTTILHVTAEAGPGAIEVSKNQYAIPAQEDTKRAIEETKRFKWRAAIYAPTVLGGIYAMNSCPPENAKWIAVAIVGVFGTVEGVRALDTWLSKRLPK